MAVFLFGLNQVVVLFPSQYESMFERKKKGFAASCSFLPVKNDEIGRSG